VFLVAPSSDKSASRPVLPTHESPEWSSFGFSKQFLEEEFCELRMPTFSALRLTRNSPKSWSVRKNTKFAKRRPFPSAPASYRSRSLSISSLVLRSSQSRPNGPPPKANTLKACIPSPMPQPRSGQ
jgi:hypothetical protein